MTGAARITGQERRSRWRCPLAVAALGAMFWLALVAWALSSPSGSSPDDEFHLANIYCATGDWTCTPEGQRAAPCYAWLPTVNGDCEPRDPRPVDTAIPMAAEPMGPLIDPVTTGVTSDRPALYPVAVSPLVGETVAETSAKVRILNAAVAVVMALLSVALSKPRIRAAVALSWILAAVPLGVFMVASVNPSSWTIVGIVALWGPLLSVLSSPRLDSLAVARLVFCQAAILMAVGSRNDSPLYIGIVTLALSALTMSRGFLHEARWRLLVPVVIGVECVAVFVRVTSGRAAYVSQLEVAPAVDDGWFQILFAGPSTVLSAVVNPSLGWLDTELPTLVDALASAALFGAVLVGAGVMYRRKAAAVGALVVPMWLLLMIVWSRTTVSQPRYFLPVLMVLTGLMLLPAARGRALLLTRTQLGLLLAALTFANSLALLTNLQRYLTGLNGTTLDPLELAALPVPQWWWQSLPLTPFQVWLLGTVAFGLGCTMMWRLLPRIGARRPAAVPTIDLRTTREVAVES